MSTVDLSATADIGCGYAARFFQLLYDSHRMRGSDGTTTASRGAYRWRCKTLGAAGDPSLKNWSDVTTDCVGYSANSTLPQSVTLDVGALPGVICASPTADLLYGACPYQGQHWDDTILNGQASGDSGYEAAGLAIVAPPGSGGNTDFVAIVGAQNTYSLCVWRDAGRVTTTDDETAEKYVCTYGGK